MCCSWLLGFESIIYKWAKKIKKTISEQQDKCSSAIFINISIENIIFLFWNVQVCMNYVVQWLQLIGNRMQSLAICFMQLKSLHRSNSQLQNEVEVMKSRICYDGILWWGAFLRWDVVMWCGSQNQYKVWVDMVFSFIHTLVISFKT